MSQAIIRLLLEARVDAWAQSKGFAIAHDNQSLTPEVDKTHVECFLLPGRTVSNFLEGSDRVFVGVFQINIVVPLNIGTADSDALATELDALFPMNLRLTSGALVLQQTSPASEGQGQAGDTHYMVPVSFQYRGDITP